MAERFDVIVIGGGPAGSLCATLLRRYTPTLRVALIERDAFPRYHIGESLVLEVNRILQDAGVLEKVEQADFLRMVRCDLIQGYLYSKPLPVAKLEEFYRDNLLKKPAHTKP